MNKIYLAALFIIFIGLTSFSQNDNGAIKVKLEDRATKEAIPFANVVAFKDGVQVGVGTTNMDGEAVIKPLSPGKYTVKGVYVGYQTQQINDVLVGEGKTINITLGLSNGDGVALEEIIVSTYQVPLIDPDTKSGQTVTREDYQNLATKDINSVAATTAGVFQADEGKALNVRGGRSGQTTYFVDGVKVFGNPNLPQQSIEQLNVITGGVPANYGDLTSGAISISTRGPQSKYFGGIEVISSELTDPYGYNSLGYSLGGPLYKKKDSTRRTVLGFFLSGQGNYVRETSPSFVPIWVLNDNKLAELKAKPLIPSRSGTGFIRNSEYVTKDDMYDNVIRPNNIARSISINGKIDFQPSSNTNITLGGFYDYSDNNSGGQGGNQIFNSVNNSQNIGRTIRGNLSITQKFGNSQINKEKSQSLISNSFFKFLVSYENGMSKNQSQIHKDNLFNYGYVGKFERTYFAQDNAITYNYSPDFLINGQTVNAYVYSGRSELPVKFTPGTLNPDAALYTSYLINNSRTPFISLDYIAGNNGLRNGDNPQSVYSLYNNFGAYPGGYSFSNQEQVRVATSFNTDIKDHAVTVGLEFDQRTFSNYGLNASALWTRMRQIVNQHTEQLDKSNPILNPDFSGLVPYYSFNYLYEEDKQTQFSEKLLVKMGLDKNYTGFINTDALDPSIFNINMFSAEDLLGNTSDNNIVSYNGYTHDGIKTNEKTDINKFLTETSSNGKLLLPIGSFRPIYSSIYLMDHFDFKDIKFNVGLRIDRYDANQQVLKDKYALHELAQVGDLGSIGNLPAGFTDNIPKNISQNAAIYVAQNPSGGKSPISIKGYRDGDKWYNSEGNEISDPNLIASSDARPIPYFKDNADYDKKMSAAAFTNYVAAIIPQPRLAFSFPISDVANFFAHYDVLSQRPTGSQLLPLEYYYMNASGSTPLITNPNQQPQRTVDYELGFQQVLNERKNASLTITSFYKEIRGQINQRVVVGAFPKNYIMYDNIDFSTVKGISCIFDFRRTGGSRINLNYTLQFADGSGSNANSGANLASTGQPNLRILQPLDFDTRHNFVLSYDYRFGNKKDYKGPSFKTKSDKSIRLFQDIGFNLSFLLNSGNPYTRWSTAVPTQGGNGRSSIVGQINGSSKPWNFRANLRLDKNINLTWGKDGPDGEKSANINIYLQVLNLFNTQNILNVFNYTGAPDDDGYLSSTQAQAALAQANSAVAYSNMYSIRMNAPGNYSLPRQIRLGLLFSF